MKWLTRHSAVTDDAAFPNNGLMAILLPACASIRDLSNCLEVNALLKAPRGGTVLLWPVYIELLSFTFPRATELP
jgi:hypothetical protein